LRNRVRVQDNLPGRRLHPGSLDPHLPEDVVPEPRRFMQRHRRRMQHVPVDEPIPQVDDGYGVPTKVVTLWGSSVALKRALLTVMAVLDARLSPAEVTHGVMLHGTAPET